MIKLIKSLTVAAAITAASTASWAGTFVQQLGWDAPDGSRITGFAYESENTKKDAPVAILMHGMMGSSLYWLAEDNLAYGDVLTSELIERGYRVLALDARRHGARRHGDKPMKILKKAKRGKPDEYLAMINDTVKDYQFLLGKIEKNFKKATDVVVIGYSMGAQMGTLLAAQDDRVTKLVTLVPPAAKNVPSVAPVKFASGVEVPWLLITAKKDEYSTKKQTQALLDAAGPKMTNVSFEGGHALPRSYVDTVTNWLDESAE